MSGRGSTPFRLRAVLLVTILFALVFAILGAYGVGKRRSSIDATRHAADQLLDLQDIRVNLVQADSIASRLYLTGGAEDPSQRQLYVGSIDKAGTKLVGVVLQLDLGGDQATAMEAANGGLAQYTGLIEQARANNRQGFPVGAAYERQANELAGKVVTNLRTVEQSQRDAVNDELAAADRAGAWLALTGWVLVAVIVLVGLWLALRFHRVVNIPLGVAVIAVLIVLILASASQGSAVNKADDAVGGSLTTADLVAQARAAAYDAECAGGAHADQPGQRRGQRATLAGLVGHRPVGAEPGVRQRLVRRLPAAQPVERVRHRPRADPHARRRRRLGHGRRHQPRRGELGVRPRRRPDGDHRTVRHVRQRQRRPRPGERTGRGGVALGGDGRPRGDARPRVPLRPVRHRAGLPRHRSAAAGVPVNRRVVALSSPRPG